MRRRHTTATFIAAARKQHGDAYRYGKVDYRKSNIPVTITCREHGDFEQRPAAHLAGNGCRLCANEDNRQRMISNHRRVQNSNRVVRLSLSQLEAIELITWLITLPIDNNTPSAAIALIERVQKAAKEPTA